jgi:hypothetical protein
VCFVVKWNILLSTTAAGDFQAVVERVQIALGHYMSSVIHYQ